MPRRIYAEFQDDPMFLLLENALNLNTPMRIPLCLLLDRVYECNVVEDTIGSPFNMRAHMQ